MIGKQTTGALGTIEISAVTHEGLSVTVNGRPAVLAIVLDGQVVASGSDVAKEAMAVSVNCYRATLQGRGHLRVMSAPIQAVGAVAPAAGAANADQSSAAA